MDINERDSAQEKENEDIFHEIIDNDIKTEIVKKEPRESVYFTKCEMCNENTDNETECVHIKNVRLGDLEQDNKLQVASLCSGDGLHNNTFKEDVKPIKVENIHPSSSQKEEDSIMNLINTEVMVKEEEYLDSPEYFFTNMENFSDCRKRVTETNKDIFQCQACSKTFSTKILLERHERRFHCKVCSKSFVNLGILEIHEKTHTEQPFHCKACSRCFSTSFNLERHERIHTGLFNCKVCSQIFSKLWDLMRHELNHTEIEFNCEVCSKSFSSKLNLAIHEKIHTGEKPFNCKICSRSFRLNCNLVKHRKTHTREKLFHCKICWKPFSGRFDLVTHQRIHTGENPSTA